METTSPDGGIAGVEWDARQSRRELASIAHDMRGPLASITTAAEILESEFLDGAGDQSNRLLSVIRRQSSRLLQMVQDLSDFLRAPENQCTVRRSEVDLACLLREVASEYACLSRAHNVVLDLREEPLRASVDQEKVSRIIQNLLLNAIQYSPAGTSIFIRLRLDESGEQVVFEVEDQGPGIAEEDRPYIFRPFVRLSDKYGGQGLGLYTVLRFAEAHGGTAWVNSAGRGARFCVALPRMSTPIENN